MPNTSTLDCRHISLYEYPDLYISGIVLELPSNRFYCQRQSLSYFSDFDHVCWILVDRSAILSCMHLFLPKFCNYVPIGRVLDTHLSIWSSDVYIYLGLIIQTLSAGSFIHSLLFSPADADISSIFPILSSLHDCCHTFTIWSADFSLYLTHLIYISPTDSWSPPLPVSPANVSLYLNILLYILYSGYWSPPLPVWPICIYISLNILILFPSAGYWSTLLSIWSVNVFLYLVIITHILLASYLRHPFTISPPRL